MAKRRRLQRRVREFLMQYTPARELKVIDVQNIADVARAVAFEAFSNLGGGDDEGKS